MAKKEVVKAVKPMAVRVSPEIRRRLKIYVAKAADDVTLQQVIGAAIDEYLKKRGA